MEIVTRTNRLRQPGPPPARSSAAPAAPAAPAVLDILRRERELVNPWRPGRVVLTAPRLHAGGLDLGAVVVGSFRLLPNGWIEAKDDELVRELELALGRREVELRALSIGDGSRESDSEYDLRKNVLPRQIRELREELDRRQDVTSELLRVETVLRIEVLREELEPVIGLELFNSEVH